MLRGKHGSTVKFAEAAHSKLELRRDAAVQRGHVLMSKSTASNSKLVDAQAWWVRASLLAARPPAAPAAPVEAAESALQLSRKQLQEVVCNVSAHQRGTAAGPSRCTFEMICAACQSSDAALDASHEMVNLIRSGELPRETFLLDVYVNLNDLLATS